MNATTEFKVWKTVESPSYWTEKQSVELGIPCSMGEAEIDLVIVNFEDLCLDSSPESWNVQKAARKAKTLGLTFVPSFILNKVGELLLQEFGNNPKVDEIYVVANDFGEIFDYKVSQGKFNLPCGGSIYLATRYGGPACFAPLIFVKPRK